MREFSVGRVLGRSFSVWSKNFVQFTLLTALAYTPLVIYTLTLSSGELTLDSLKTWAIAGGLGGIVLDLLATSAIIYGVFQQLRGQHASLGVCLRVGVGRVLPTLGVILLMGLCIVGAGIAAALPGLLLSVMWFATVAGAVVCLILLTMLYVSVPVSVVERPGLTASLKRSRELTENHRLSILAIIIVLFVLDWVTNEILEAVVSDVRAFMLLTLGASIVLGALTSVVSAVLYHDLRSSKESIGIDDLASVFE